MPGRFGTIYPFVESRDSSLRMGRLVANFEFLKALLESGLFDEYHFYSQDAGIQRLLIEKLNQLGIDERSHGIKHLLYFDIKNAISKIEYNAFHLGGFGFFMPGLAYIRNNWAKNPFPITGITHSLNGFESPFHFLKLCKAPFGPQDCLVCSSNAGKQVVENYIKATRRDFNASFGGRIEQIPLGIDDIHFTTRDRKAARAQLGWSDNTLYLLSIGRFSPAVKTDHGPLLACIRRMVRKGGLPPFKLVLAGGSDLGLQLVKNMIKEYALETVVEVIADFDDAKKLLLYSGADAYLSLSDNFQETFGLSVVEAMAHGLPALVSDWNGYKELVREGQDGFRIPTSGPSQLPLMDGITEVMRFSTIALLYSQTTVIDQEQLENKIRRLLLEPELRRTLGESAQQQAQQYRWSQVMQRYGRLWTELYELSRAQIGASTPKNNPFEINYTSVFNHYFTATTGADSRYSLAWDGEAVLKGTQGLPGKYGDVQALLIDELLVLLLQRIGPGGSLSGAEIAENLTAAGVNVDSSLLSIHLLWLAKYGLLRIDRDAP